jgi:hypothetical protein
LAHILNEDELRETDSAVIVIKYLISNLRESYKKDDHKFKGIAAREYLAGLTKLAVNRDNKFKVSSIESDRRGIIRLVSYKLFEDDGWWLVDDLERSFKVR